MPKINFHDFLLNITPAGEGGVYKAEVLHARGGDASATFSWAELQAGLDDVAAHPDGPAAAPATRTFVLDDDESTTLEVAQAQPPAKGEAEALGRALFRSVFKGGLAEVLRRSYDKAWREGRGLRLRLNLTDSPGLAALPWEFIFDDRFYARSDDTPVVRYLNSTAELPSSLAVKGPLRMLVVIANLPELPLNVEEEWKRLNDALRVYQEEGLLEIKRLDGSSVRALETCLSEAKLDKPFHIFHFIGHGGYDKISLEGQLVVTDENGTGARALSATRLSEILRGHRDTLRLVVLNACEGARAAGTNSYAGVAQSLISQGGIPAVVAMQYKITDLAAIEFTRQFYGTMAVGYPVETALSYARRAIDDDSKVEWAEWATPVLYLRADDGQLFATPPPRIPPPAPHIRPELGEHYSAVIEQLKKGKLVPFIGLDANLYGRQPDPEWEPGSHLPGSGELAAYLKRHLRYPDGEILDLVSVSQYAFVNADGVYGELYQIFSDAFGKPYEPTPLHHFLARLPKLLRDSGYPKVSIPADQRFVIATTTYDGLLELAFKDVLPYHVVSYVTSDEQPGVFLHSKYANGELVLDPEEIRDPPRFNRMNDTDPVILKLPGAVDYEQRFAITEDHFSDYMTHRSMAELLPPQLRGKLKSSYHLFLGSTLRNWHLRALLYRVWESRRPTSAGWAVHPTPPDIDRKYWRLSKVKVVQSDYEAYIAGLTETLALHLKAAG